MAIAASPHAVMHRDRLPHGPFSWNCVSCGLLVNCTGRTLVDRLAPESQLDEPMKRDLCSLCYSRGVAGAP